MASIMDVRKGDIIIERVGGKKRMTPVRQVDFNACSSKGVHVNRNACYENTATVDLVDGNGTLGDLDREVSGLGDREEDRIDPLSDQFVLTTFDVNLEEAWAEEMENKLVKH